MYFTHLKEDLADPSKRNDDINKQRINLSDHARSILLHDMDAFHDQLGIATGCQKINSTIINHIFRWFWENADASVYRSCENKRLQLSKTLGELDESVREQAIHPLVKEHRRVIEEQVRCDLAKKGTAESVRLSAANLRLLSKPPFPDWEESTQDAAQRLYRDKVGLYLKALIEEYARKPYYEREAIFCKQNLHDIQEAIREGRMIRVVTRNKYIQYVKPYSVQADSEQLYHYLSGFISGGIDGGWKLGSLRLSSITECAILHNNGTLSSDMVEKLKTAIQKKGIQFLSDVSESEKPAKIVVQFTGNGKQMYHRMLHLRPMYSAIREGLIYEFTITQRQAENYFFKFGHNVKILEPRELADKFRRRYESAAKQYK